MAKLSVKAFALAGGILWGASLFILTWLQIWGYGSITADAMVKSYYIWYSVTPVGSVVGAICGFLDAGIACAIFALIYNKLAAK